MFFLPSYVISKYSAKNIWQYLLPLPMKKLLNRRLAYKVPSTLQVAWPNWWSGLAEQLKSPGVDDKPSGFITLNEANRLCHPVWLNVGKCQRKAGRLRYLRFFRPRFLSSNFPQSLIPGSSNLQLWWDRGVGSRWWKLRPKNRRLWSWSAFLRSLSTFSQIGWQSRLASFNVIKLLGLLSTPGLWSCSTKPLGLAAPPIWPGDLQYGRAFRLTSWSVLQTK